MYMATGHAHNNDAHGHDGYDSDDEKDNDEYGGDADRRPNIPADRRKCIRTARRISNVYVRQI